MERIVITGATGFLGSYLAKRFLAEGFKVYALVRPDSKNLETLFKKLEDLPQRENLQIVRCSLSQVMDIVEEIGEASGFFHFAWGGVNREEIDSPSVQAENVAGSLNCIRAAHALKCKVFMDAGSRVEYGVTDSVMWEELTCHPVNEYGKAKLDFYQKAVPLCREFGFNYYHLRFFSVYGYGDHAWSIISTLVRDLRLGKTVPLSACLHQWNFMYIEDAAEAVFQLYQCGKSKEDQEWIVNIASRDTRQLKSFVEEIRKIAGGMGAPEYGLFAQAKEGALSVRPSVSRLEELTEGNYQERFSFHDGILDMIKKDAG